AATSSHAHDLTRASFICRHAAKKISHEPTAARVSTNIAPHPLRLDLRYFYTPGSLTGCARRRLDCGPAGGASGQALRWNCVVGALWTPYEAGGRGAGVTAGWAAEWGGCRTRRRGQLFPSHLIPLRW